MRQKQSSKVRIGIVGTGGMARAHLQGYRALVDAGYDQFEIAALSDVNEERRKAFAAVVEELFGLSPLQFASAEEMAQRGDLNAADICTPHAFHHSVAVPCLEAGLDVMVEKPCGISIKATDQIIKAASKKDRIVAVAEQVRRGLKARCMEWAINHAQMVGALRFLSVTGFSEMDFAAQKDAYAWQWRFLRLLTGGGMAFDAGVHFADMMDFLFGDVEEVSAWTKTFQSVMVDSPELGPQPMDVEDTWMAIITFKSGLVCNWSWSFSALGEKVAAQILYGALGSIRDRGGWMHTFQNGGDITYADGARKPYEEIEAEYRAQLEPEVRERLFPFGIEHDIALECWDFIDSVQKRRKPEIDAETAKRTKSLCLAIYESALAGRPVKVADVFTGKISAYQDPINDYWRI
ncbi:MAG: Gfo/Idh/MocA family oxidoreductase [Candidatus Latescibacteria bacterium]|nr:Gfo/Idh/MocA family oxidoreductase [Candidatus Latescibacterota bacterium]